MRGITAALPFLVALAGVAAGQRRPNFTGDWVLDRARSRLEYPEPGRLDSAVVRIAHADSAFVFIRRFVVNGRADTLSWTLVPGGAEDSSSEGTQQSFSRLRWAGDTLVLESRIVTPRGQAGDTVRYRLLEGGRVLEANERFRAPRLRYDNSWVFVRR